MNRITMLLQGLFAAVSDTLHGVMLRYMEWLGATRYVAHTAAASFTDTLYYISANLPATYDQAGYAATTVTWTLIGKVQDFPTYGSQRDVTTFKPIAGSVEKLKGVADYGSGDLNCADVPADAGQIILKAAEASPNHYSMRAIYPDNEIAYFDVLVSSWRLAPAKQGDVMIRTGMINFCKAPVIVAAT
jgi:hypothetical protein